MTHDLRCNFCGKHQREVYKLIAGPAVYICDECVQLCTQTLGAAPPARGPTPIDPAALLAALDARVVGQRAAKRALAAALVRSRLLEPAELAPRVLLVGPCGCGKSELGAALVANAGVPAFHADASALTETGYVGDDLEALVFGVLRAAERDAELAGRGVLFLDGLEKIKAQRPLGVTVRDIGGAQVQLELARLLDGGVLALPPVGGARHPSQAKIPVDTRRMTIVAALRAEGWEVPTGERALRSELARAGLLGSLVARFSRVVAMPALDAAELERVGALLGAEGSIRELAAAAAKAPDGAWSLRAELARLGG